MCFLMERRKTETSGVIQMLSSGSIFILNKDGHYGCQLLFCSVVVTGERFLYLPPSVCLPTQSLPLFIQYYSTYPTEAFHQHYASPWSLHSGHGMKQFNWSGLDSMPTSEDGGSWNRNEVGLPREKGKDARLAVAMDIRCSLLYMQMWQAFRTPLVGGFSLTFSGQVAYDYLEALGL